MKDFKDTMPALRASLFDIVNEYNEKLSKISDLEKELKRVVSFCEMGTQIGGTYGGSVWMWHSPSLNDPAKVLLISAWKHVYNGLNIDLLATVSERDKFKRDLENPPKFTIENIREMFGKYVADPRTSILRGMAEVFADLDPAYKSHSKVKVGVKGLPKRIIIANAGSYYGANYGTERLKNVLNAIRVYRGQKHLEYREFDDVRTKAARQGESEIDGMTLRGFRNGNMHVIFDAAACRDINLALAEYYGEVLPDMPDESAKVKGTAVSKDLAYYPTPVSVAERVVGSLYLPENSRVLEPSCGCGRLMEQVRKQHPKSVIHGIEYDPGRAALARSKGFTVQVENFLEVPPDGSYDAVIMNPPFAGRHWKKHLEHAKKFTKKNVVCILPATAYYDGHLEDERGQWFDLPVGSFAESGTNVPTGYFVTKGAVI
jgi:hypothetical protein